MSPKQKTATKRHANKRPNKRNLKKRNQIIHENSLILQSLAKD